MSRMNRRAFLKRAGLMAAAAVVAPKVLFAEKPRYVNVVHDPEIEFEPVGMWSNNLTTAPNPLAHAMRQTKEQVYANVLNRAFSRRYLT